MIHIMVINQAIETSPGLTQTLVLSDKYIIIIMLHMFKKLSKGMECI